LGSSPPVLDETDDLPVSLPGFQHEEHKYQVDSDPDDDDDELESFLDQSDEDMVDDSEPSSLSTVGLPDDELPVAPPSLLRQPGVYKARYLGGIAWSSVLREESLHLSS